MSNCTKQSKTDRIKGYNKCIGEREIIEDQAQSFVTGQINSFVVSGIITQFAIRSFELSLASRFKTGGYII